MDALIGIVFVELVNLEYLSRFEQIQDFGLGFLHKLSYKVNGLSLVSDGGL